jgi:hypothetical protein
VDLAIVLAWFGWHRREPALRPGSQSRQEIEPERPADIVEKRQKTVTLFSSS